MNNWFDRFKPGKNKTNNNNNNTNSNPLSGLFQIGNATTASFSGQGQSLGGNKPGRIIPVEITASGPIGIRLERTTTNTTTTSKTSATAAAIVQSVLPGSQAEQLDLQRGDILCFAGSDGQEEIPYEMFLELARSEQRPICFEVRRVPQTKATTTSSTATNNSKNANSADAYARKQAVIAAAEKREQLHKQKTKPIAPIKKQQQTDLPKLLSTAEKRQLEYERQQQQSSTSEETQEILKQQAKLQEQSNIQNLGFNPYETRKVSAGQARNAVTVSTHGEINATAAAATNGSTTNPIPPTHASQQQPQPSTSEEFKHAFEIFVTSASSSSSSSADAGVHPSVAILKKLIVNATTKDEDKFRKVRLANPKIQQSVTNVPGAVELLLSVGFVLLHEEETDESVLQFIPPAPAWIPTAIAQLEQYIASSSS
jgi:hypothetical protein